MNKTLKQLGIHKARFYKWYKAYLDKGYEGLEPLRKTHRQWNPTPEEQRQLVMEVALEHPVLSPRELAVKFTDEQKVFIAESSAYRILKAKGLIPSPAYRLLAAAREFKEKTTAAGEMWQTDLLTSKFWDEVGITSVLFIDSVFSVIIF